MIKEFYIEREKEREREKKNRSILFRLSRLINLLAANQKLSGQRRALEPDKDGRYEGRPETVLTIFPER